MVVIVTLVVTELVTAALTIRSPVTRRLSLVTLVTMITVASGNTGMR